MIRNLRHEAHADRIHGIGEHGFVDPEPPEDLAPGAPAAFLLDGVQRADRAPAASEGGDLVGLGELRGLAMADGDSAEVDLAALERFGGQPEIPGRALEGARGDVGSKLLDLLELPVRQLEHGHPGSEACPAMIQARAGAQALEALSDLGSGGVLHRCSLLTRAAKIVHSSYGVFFLYALG